MHAERTVLWKRSDNLYTVSNVSSHSLHDFNHFPYMLLKIRLLQLLAHRLDHSCAHMELICPLLLRRACIFRRHEALGGAQAGTVRSYLIGVLVVKGEVET